MLSSKKSKNAENIFDDGTTRIYIVQEKSLEASGAEWKFFGDHFRGATNSEIFHEVETIPLTKEMKALLPESRKVVVLSDVKRIFEECIKSKEFENHTVAEFKLEMSQMMQEIMDISFSLEYELPLNKRFVTQFTKIIERRGFVVSDTLPQSSVTIFGKSQPDLVFYKANEGYEKGTRIMGATISSDISWEVCGATMEFKRSPVHLKTKSQPLAQSCANMVRLAGFLMEKSLVKGHIVEEVTIFGLLVSHSNPYCVPLQYNAKVNQNTIIMKGDEILFEDAFRFVLMHL